MRKRFLLLSLLGSLIATSALGQPTAPAPEPGTAALRQRLVAAPTDTARVRALHALAQASMATDFDSAWQYASRARTLAGRIGDARGLFASYADLGVLNGMRGNDEASLRLFLAQLRLADKVGGGEQQKPAIYSNMAHSYFVLGRYGRALAMMRQAQRLDERAGNAAGVLDDLGNIAEIQLRQGRPAAALATVREGLRRRRLAPAGGGAPDFGLDIHLGNALLELGRYAAARDTLLALPPGCGPPARPTTSRTSSTACWMPTATWASCPRRSGPGGPPWPTPAKAGSAAPSATCWPCWRRWRPGAATSRPPTASTCRPPPSPTASRPRARLSRCKTCSFATKRRSGRPGFGCWTGRRWPGAGCWRCGRGWRWRPG